MRKWLSGAESDNPNIIVGLALSGGGIRSATISLGVLQALAEEDRLKAIDLMSTVSGGGYIGCFLCSLFFPSSLRGIDQTGPASTDAEARLAREITEHHAFATATLKSGPGIARVKAPGTDTKVCNPIWWLREHSRYLAPNGASDFAKAASYLSRNWLGMLFVFATAAFPRPPKDHEVLQHPSIQCRVRTHRQGRQYPRSPQERAVTPSSGDKRSRDLRQISWAQASAKSIGSIT